MDSLNDIMQKKLNQREDWRERYRKSFAELAQYPAIQDFIAKYRPALTDEMIKKGASKLREFMIEDRKRMQGDRVASPHLQPVLQFNGREIMCAYEKTPAYIQEEEEKKIADRVQTLFLPESLKKAHLSSIDICSERVEVVDALTQFAEDFQKARGFVKGIYLHGPFGRGKTYLLACLLHEVSLSGYRSALAHLPSLMVECKQRMNTVEGYGALLENLKTVDVLVLDDIGAEMMTPWTRDEILMPILQYRMQERKTTFFTSNLTMEELKEHFRLSSRGDDEPLKAARLMERIQYLARPIALFGPNYRQAEE
ncbi:primosomal protein DnaI [Atopobacter sp. AH10]|uniref:primosomal protein DnaI n=1 Tax=Atopobacter sp. AH10 TaxID=2315861 RepID=UPI000EF1F10F|nr:primosomal protein DnaI [Atopobacter sp. AH10]RLK64125.1 primosomal protein DnaI [Atopobacter sp. AH10]